MSNKTIYGDGGFDKKSKKEFDNKKSKKGFYKKNDK